MTHSFDCGRQESVCVKVSSGPSGRAVPSAPLARAWALSCAAFNSSSLPQCGDRRHPMVTRALPSVHHLRSCHRRHRHHPQEGRHLGRHRHGAALQRRGSPSLMLSLRRLVDEPQEDEALPLASSKVSFSDHLLVFCSLATLSKRKAKQSTPRCFATSDLAQKTVPTQCCIFPLGP